MRKEKELILRYSILLIIAIIGIIFLYPVLIALTVYPVYLFLKLFFETYLSGNLILVEGISISIVEACVAGSAYILLLGLNLTTPMKPKQRVYSLIFTLGLFYLINLIRISLFSILSIKNFSLFQLTHMFFWYFLSIALVIILWFTSIKLFKIKNIPVYSDIKFLYKKSTLNKK